MLEFDQAVSTDGEGSVIEVVIGRRCSTIWVLSACNGEAGWAWRTRQLSSRGIESSRTCTSPSRVESCGVDFPAVEVINLRLQSAAWARSGWAKHPSC